MPDVQVAPIVWLGHLTRTSSDCDSRPHMTSGSPVLALKC